MRCGHKFCCNYFFNARVCLEYGNVHELLSCHSIVGSTDTITFELDLRSLDTSGCRFVFSRAAIGSGSVSSDSISFGSTSVEYSPEPHGIVRWLLEDYATYFSTRHSTRSVFFLKKKKKRFVVALWYRALGLVSLAIAPISHVRGNNYMSCKSRQRLHELQEQLRKTRGVHTIAHHSCHRQ